VFNFISIKASNQDILSALKTGLQLFLELQNQPTLKSGPSKLKSPDRTFNFGRIFFASSNLGSFLITLAQPALLVHIVHLYRHQVFTLAQSFHIKFKLAELVLIVFYHISYIFFSPSTCCFGMKIYYINMLLSYVHSHFKLLEMS